MTAPVPGGPTGHYFGLETIATRMGVSKSTIVTWHRRYRFPLYARRVGPRTVWYTHEGLIHTWELARCDDEHRRRFGSGEDPWRPDAAPADALSGATGRASLSAARGSEAVREVIDVLESLSRNVRRLGELGASVRDRGDRPAVPRG